MFSAVPLLGNPVAVVLDGDGLDDETMARFASWTNLSETTFVQSASDERADYRLRIFTPSEELPFAGHPTLGSAHAWLAAGGRPKNGRAIVQQCGLGLVTVADRTGGRLAFAAPPPLRTGPVEAELLDTVRRGLGLTESQVVDSQWVDNGPGWLGLLLGSSAEVLALEPDVGLLEGFRIGVVGPEPAGGIVDFQVRAFAPSAGVDEDPVTGSLNASLAQWLIATGRAAPSYVAGQGARLGRDGRVYIEADGDEIWVGGDCTIGIEGSVLIG
ncbi:MAG: hypothetical protein JWN95_3134 [Frankiales bacterium]|nr:hypothetical protein [Frankiales bacterium]